MYFLMNHERTRDWLIARQLKLGSHMLVRLSIEKGLRSAGFNGRSNSVSDSFLRFSQLLQYMHMRNVQVPQEDQVALWQELNGKSTADVEEFKRDHDAQLPTVDVDTVTPTCPICTQQYDCIDNGMHSVSIGRSSFELSDMHVVLAVRDGHVGERVMLFEFCRCTQTTGREQH